jgi:thioredoxin-like negative regulator of GroEL
VHARAHWLVPLLLESVAAAVAARPDDTLLRLDLADLLALEGRMDEAHAALSEAIRLDPEEERPASPGSHSPRRSN